MVQPWSRRRWAVVALVMVALGVLLAFVLDYAAENRGALEQGEARDARLARIARTNAARLKAAQADVGALARQVKRLGGEPVVTPQEVPPPVPVPPPAPLPAPSAGDTAERQERERQEPERQQPERQQRERQESERQQSERQDAESDDADPDSPEAQDDEVQDEELQEAEDQEPEEQEPEVQEDEVQDEERDDPDPNSALDFAVDDQCNPAEGEFVTDVSASWQRSPGTVTLVLTCTSTAVPAGIQP